MILIHTYREFFLSLGALWLGALIGAWATGIGAFRTKCELSDLRVKYRRLLEAHTEMVGSSAVPQAAQSRMNENWQQANPGAVGSNLWPPQ